MPSFRIHTCPDQRSPLAFLNQILGVKGLVAPISGGASGIGLAAAELFTAAGMNVHILDFNEQTGTEQSNRINALGHSGKCSFLRLDVTSKDACDGAINQIIDQTGRIDVLLNRAGSSHIILRVHPISKINSTNSMS